MPDSKEGTSLAESLRELIPTEQQSDELGAALDNVAKLEHEHREFAEQTRLERAFLERAPKEGLMHPGDALKLEDVAAKLREAGDGEQALQQVYRTMRTQRPYLFAAPPSSPANRKLSDGANDAAPGLTHGNLTRQVQELRRKRR